MKKYILAAALVLVSASVMASGEPATVVHDPNDQHSWQGDTVVFHVDYSKVKDSEGKYLCAADDSRFLVTHEDKNTYQLSGVFDSLGNDGRPNCDAVNKILEHTTYTLEKAEIEKIAHSRRGWTFGALVVPFKYQTSDKSFGGSTSIGPYLGYRIAPFKYLNGTSTTFIASAGYANNIAVPTAPGVAPAGSVNRSGLSLAAGIIFAVDKGEGIQVGVLVGQDRLGSNATAPYAYEGKTWVSVAIGYKFF